MMLKRSPLILPSKRSLLWLLLPLPLWQCGGGGASPEPGGQTLPESQRPPGDITVIPPAAGVEIVLNTPADTEQAVSITPVFRVTFDAPLDVSSVSSAQITLAPLTAPLNRSTDRLPVQVTTSDDQQALLITPDTALQNGHRYRLSVANLRFADGSDAPQRSYELFTPRRVIDRREIFGFNEAGEIAVVRLEVYRYTAETLSEIVTYGDPGNDGQWQTTDDAISSLTLINTDNNQETAVTYFDPGPDGTWRTADDQIDNIRQTTFDNEGIAQQQITLIGPGNDGVWQTEDDLPELKIIYDMQGREAERYEFSYSGPTEALIASSYIHTRFDRDSNLSTALSVNAGDDNQFFTSDDIEFTLETEAITDDFFITPAGSILSALSWHPGDDGQWLTGDDNLQSYSRLQQLSEERIATIYQYNEPGADGQWFTDDDPISTVFLKKSRNDRSIGSVILPHYIDPGADGQWLTSDDTIGEYYEHQYDVYDQTRIFTVRYYTDPGEDGTWLNDDDNARSWIREVTNGFQQRTEEEIFTRTPGRDAIVTHRLTLYDYDDQGNLTTITQRRHPGDDGIWNTDDDWITDKTYYRTN